MPSLNSVHRSYSRREIFWRGMRLETVALFINVFVVSGWFLFAIYERGWGYAKIQQAMGTPAERYQLKQFFRLLQHVSSWLLGMLVATTLVQIWERGTVSFAEGVLLLAFVLFLGLFLPAQKKVERLFRLSNERLPMRTVFWAQFQRMRMTLYLLHAMILLHVVWRLVEQR